MPPVQSTLKRQRIAARPVTNAQVFKKDDTDGIKAHLEFFGFAVVRVLDAEQCKEAIKDQIENILLKQPWIQKLVVKDRATGEVLDIHVDTDRYIAELTTPGIPKEALKHYEEVWPMHIGFGACCDPNAFHLRTMWNVRQDEDLCRLMQSIFGRLMVHVDINRGIQKLPLRGEDEFLHWDKAVLDPDTDDNPFPEVCGKVMFTDGSFVCVPGTHTQVFMEEFRAKYAALYPRAKPTDAKFGLDPEKPDPMHLRSQRESIAIPAGCAIFWSPFLLHGTEKSPRSAGIAFGMYLGYLLDIDRPAYDGDERQDRIDSFMEGRAPRMWPSLDRVHYFPWRFFNFPQHIKKYVEKTEEGYEGRDVHTIKSGPKKGTQFPLLRPVLDPDYTPAALTETGEMLLGKRKRED